MSKPDSENRFRIDDGPAARMVTLAAIVSVIGLALLVAWTVVARVDEVAKARGAVEPLAQVQRIESRYGGLIEQVSISLGAVVREGDVLVRLDRTAASSELDAASTQIAALSLQIERLEAFIEDRDPDFSEFEDRFPTLVELEVAALAAQRAFIEGEVAVLQSQIAQKQAEIEAIEEERPQLVRQIAIAQEEREIQEGLIDRGLAARPQLVELVEQEASYRFELARLAGQAAIAEATITELETSIERVRLEQVANARMQVVEALEQVRALEAQLEALQQRVAETEIVAPLSGVIQSLPDEMIGNVIDPGGVVATIVPQDGGLRFAGRLAPRDVAFVEVGQPVRVKVDSFDFSRYGALEGTVEEVSPTTFVDEQGQAYYEVLVSLPQTFFRDAADGLDLQPGMTGEADIVTGNRTIFEYVWKPVFTNLDLALTER